MRKCCIYTNVGAKRYLNAKVLMHTQSSPVLNKRMWVSMDTIHQS